MNDVEVMTKLSEFFNMNKISIQQGCHCMAELMLLLSEKQQKEEQMTKITKENGDMLDKLVEESKEQAMQILGMLSVGRKISRRSFVAALMVVELMIATERSNNINDFDELSDAVLESLKFFGISKREEKNGN